VKARLTEIASASILATMIEPIQKLTADEYLALERAAEFRSELVDGEMVAMSGGSYEHSSVTGNLFGELRNRLKGGSCRASSCDLRVLAPVSNLYSYPDIVVVCGEPRFLDERRDTLLNPTLLAEVLSPSTESYDRGRKFAQYREIDTLAEYLLVAQDAPRIEQFVRADDGRWIYSVASGLEATLELPSLGTVIALAEVYDKVELGG
jgi:Uma2 family endonuclease